MDLTGLQSIEGAYPLRPCACACAGGRACVLARACGLVCEMRRRAHACACRLTVRVPSKRCARALSTCSMHVRQARVPMRECTARVRVRPRARLVRGRGHAPSCARRVCARKCDQGIIGALVWSRDHRCRAGGSPHGSRDWGAHPLTAVHTFLIVVLQRPSIPLSLGGHRQSLPVLKLVNMLPLESVQ